jgi:glycosyltransferase involved in cell wall biosynthesis
MTGRVAREELIGWYRTADVFVSMSRHEAFGITLLEAAVGGARVVASDIEAHREVAGYLPAGTVRLVDPAASPEDLSEAILAAAAAGPVTGAEACVPTWRGAAERTLAVYQAVAQGRTQVASR